MNDRPARPALPVFAWRVLRRSVVRAADSVAPTWRSKRFWRNRQRHEPEILADWWSTRDLPYRMILAEQVADLDSRSMLEVGCGVGANLSVIHERLPDVALTGTDINETALAYARERIPASLIVAAADRLPFDDNSFDLVATAVVLCCIGPDHIDRAMRELVRVTRSHLLLLESNADETVRDVYPNTTYWWRDYRTWLPGATVEELPDVAKHGHVRHLIRWRKPNPD
jgi:SAM-dependent methyltransferase